jgi:hypothetical protein
MRAARAARPDRGPRPFGGIGLARMRPDRTFSSDALAVNALDDGIPAVGTTGSVAGEGPESEEVGGHQQEY